MSRLRVLAFSISLDGFSAGPDQSLENPLGVMGTELMEWAFPTRFFGQMQGRGGGETGVDNGMAEDGFRNIGAWILGRNMYGPVRGPWLDESWKGWWGEEPPYHVPVFVLTHPARKPLATQGGTTFHVVPDGADAALKRAREAAPGAAVRSCGGVAAIRQYRPAGQL